MKIKIFYSWQSSTNTKFNRNFIRTCIDKTVKKLKRKEQFLKIDFEVLDGVRGEPGSPSVASKITDDRIPSCDIFIADLSVINHISKGKKIVRRLIGDKFKPFQNNNVINEHGVALNAIGKERIIGVLNSVYGSPNKNPDNIPFDLRHLSFPIEYSYSAKTRSKENEQNLLVSKLSSALKQTIIHAIKHQKDKYRPFCVWRDWEAQINTSQKFHQNDIVKVTINQIQEGVKNTKQSIRLIGLSGLGKTRILLEAFRATEEAEKSGMLSERVLYLNCNLYSSLDYQTLFSKITSEENDRIVVLDNCSRRLHRELLHFVQNENNSISLITIDSNPEEIDQDKINGVNYIIIRKDDLSSIVENILQEDSAILGDENIERIKEFSQGIPLMAVLISDSIKNGEKFVGKLDDKELLDKLLGEKGNDKKCRTILKSCSIFSYFGFEAELNPQIKFIATNKNITSLDGDDQVLINDFYEVCNFYLKREIFERKGRFIGMRPFPLAMSLTQEWLEPCTSERLLNVIVNIAQLEEPHRKNLSEAIAEQMKYLGYNEKAILIVDEIVGPNSPFDNAEVLNTELGSRLFRSFVEVNPVAVLKNLVRVFSPMTKDELLKVDAGRRNLVWVLEKLCFDKRTFSDGAKILYSFAVAENETWSNNATGQFLQLFKIILAGTEANLKQRWEVISWGLNLNDSDYFELAVKALKSGLDYGHFGRMGGSEKQGSRMLQDHYPNNKEVRKYWTNILETLTSIIKDNGKYSGLASESINNSIRPLCNARFASVLLPFIEEIIKHKNNDWDEGLKGLKFARKFEKGLLTKEELDKIDGMINLLTKKDFQTRFNNISDSPYLDDSEPYSSEKIIETVVNLAEEFISTGLSWKTNFPIFYSGRQIYTYHFGRKIYELIQEKKSKVDEFINLSLETIETIEKENRDVSILVGFIAKAEEVEKEIFYINLSQNSKLNYLLFHFLSIDKKGKRYYPMLFSLVDEGKCELQNFSTFSYSNSLKHCNKEEIIEFSKILLSYGEEGYLLVFDILYSLSYNEKELQTSLIPLFKECIYKLGINKKAIRQLDTFRWAQTISSILESSKEFELAQFINNSIINSITWDNYYHLDHDIQKIYSVLMIHHFKKIWNDLSKALLSEGDDYVKFYGLKQILGSHIGDVTRPVGILFEGDIDSIFEWCKDKSPKAPARLAELVPIYDGNNNEYSTWHPLAKKLIDNYGDIEEVLSNLSANMGTYSWVGSVVPLIEAQKELFESLTNHDISQVAEWAKRNLEYAVIRIKDEKNRDEEMYL
ncbi:hypothetical protein GM418_19435 [Maribellus comscasis]|uniref:Uncharacterized protein n=1 Tax=Maribellus comscasis TaxID=2681766 RepID=A0A6I6JRU3_9BACT|nr:hypothetical protein [Maribellus comscasis]QGY45765.1 hypothetical protein GM418_19435 [Maribellus comscasis]